MGITLGISALIGAALGLRYKVIILVPLIILAGISVAIVEAVRGDRAGHIALTIVLAATVLQISYLVGCVARAAIEGRVVRERNAGVPPNITEHMEVVGSDGGHVGVVDHTESADRIVLTGDDPKAGGPPQLLPVDWVDYVDSKVHLNRPSDEAVLERR